MECLEVSGILSKKTSRRKAETEICKITRAQKPLEKVKKQFFCYAHDSTN
jgi:hypothetical protein